MNYNIRNLNKGDDKNHPLYIFDTSVWLKILRTKIGAPEGNDQMYLNFFKSMKNRGDKPKVVLTTLIISEIVNRWLREYGLYGYWDEFPEENERYYKLSAKEKKEYYKKHYRGSDHYKKIYKDICDDLLSYEPLCVCQSDEFGGNICLEEIMTSKNFKLDFNDNYFVTLAKKKNIPIVTDDLDFFVPDIAVFTANNRLLEKAKSSIQIGTVTTIGDIMKAKMDEKANKNIKPSGA